MEAVINFQPKQADLMDMIEATGDREPTKLGDGGARGGGKSGLLRRAMVIRRLENPGTVGFIVRRYFSDLAENHIEKFRLEFPELAAYWREGDKEYRFPNASRIAFLYGENKAAVQSISRGPECMDLFIDQAEEFTEEELIMLAECNRWPGSAPGACKTVMFFNPGGAGTEYLRRIFWKREFRENESAHDFSFVPAYGWDNYEWCRGEVDIDSVEFYALPDTPLPFDPDTLLSPSRRCSGRYPGCACKTRFEIFIHHTTYGRRMRDLPPALRTGELLGSFERFAGQYYAGVWDENTCVLPVSLAESLIQPWWTRWMSQDWGFGHHNANLWYAAGKLKPEQASTLGIATDWPVDVVIVYREHVVSGVGEEDLAREIADLTPAEERRMVTAYWLGPDAWAKRGSGHTVAEQIGRILKQKGLPEPEMADNARTTSSEDRIGGWRFLYNAFQRNAWRTGAEEVTQEMAQSGPLLLISASCPEVISAIPLLIRDDDKLEDVLKTNTIGDDVADSLRYGFKSQLNAKPRAPRDVRARELAASIQNPTARHLALLKFQEEERRRNRIARPRWR